jgi:hypothetical protein
MPHTATTSESVTLPNLVSRGKEQKKALRIKRRRREKQDYGGSI